MRGRLATIDGWMVRENVAECESELLVAWIVMVAEAGAVAMLAPMRNVEVAVVFAATETLKGLTGLVATPEGRPEIVARTMPEKAPFGAIEIVIDCGTLPWGIVRLAGVTERVKSGEEVEVGGGVGPGGVLAVGASCDVVPPPQAVVSIETVIRKGKNRMAMAVWA